MPRVTRSTELLSFVDGLFYIDDNVIDLASQFYTELRSTSATFGEDSIERLVPHIVSLMTELNNVIKENIDLKREVQDLSSTLQAAENRCTDLNSSYREKAGECHALEDQLEARIAQLNADLTRGREENLKLTKTLSELQGDDIVRLLDESEDKIAALSAERRCLLTTIEVLDADVRCVRGQLSRLEEEKKSWESGLLPEALDDDTPSARCIPPEAVTTPSAQPAHRDIGHTEDFKDVLIIGDSLLRYASKKSVYRGAYLECCPGGKIRDVKNILLGYLDVRLSVIYFHVGTNNLRKGFRGGPGYNGGHGKREVLHDMADLLFTART